MYKLHSMSSKGKTQYSICQINARPKGRWPSEHCYLSLYFGLISFFFFCSFHLFFLFLDPVHLSGHISRDMSDRYRQTAQSSGKCRYCTLHTSCSFNSGKLVSLKKACHYFVTPCPKWHLQQISLPAKRHTKKTSAKPWQFCCSAFVSKRKKNVLTDISNLYKTERS